MIEHPSPLISNPEFIKGWNAAISHAENSLVAGAYLAMPGSPSVATGRSDYPMRVLLQAAEMIGRTRRPTQRHYG